MSYKLARFTRFVLRSYFPLIVKRRGSEEGRGKRKEKGKGPSCCVFSS